MFHKLPIFHLAVPPAIPRVLFISAALLAILVFTACSSSSESQDSVDESSDGLELVWESWDKINERYASSAPLDPDSAVSGAIGRLLNLIEVSPYPFLTEIGRMRGQPPTHVPGDLVDLWRAVAKHQASNPDFDPATISAAAVTGLLEGLGDSSAVYLDAEQYPLAKDSLEGGLEGSYLGIGSRVVSQDGQIVLFPFAGSPSESAGILPGDILIGVAGRTVLGQSVQEVVDQVAGPKGTKVVLDVIRAGEIAPVAVEVFRGDIELQSVVSQLIPGGVAYLRISRFRDNTGEQVFSALEEMNQFDMLALVVDLRTNPGGSSEAARQTASQFLPDGTVFGFTEGKDGKRTELTTGPNENRLPMDDLLIAVLVNGQTAREAEILAAALQDSERATLVGAPTLGDASKDELVELSDGSAMYLPVSRRYAPLGDLLCQTGFVADAVVEAVAG
ncbi:MAG: PDZ domain-containing protein, partial [Chloroflexi bacterium]|nr:PDZ domain-containing protein [Chloroflexota bacterium]